MCELVKLLTEQVPEAALARNCVKEGCKVSLQGAPSPHLIIDLDHPLFNPGHGVRCDFLFVSCDCEAGDWVVPLELKKGSPNGPEMSGQLQAGAALAQARIPPGNHERFLPVGVYGGRLRKEDRDRLRKARISFRGRKYEITLIRCGAPLTTALAVS